MNVLVFSILTTASTRSDAGTITCGVAMLHVPIESGVPMLKSDPYAQVVRLSATRIHVHDEQSTVAHTVEFAIAVHNV